MNHPKSSKLTHTEQEQLAELAAQTTQQTALEFATPEQMLRHDSYLTHVPPSLVERLRASIAREPSPERPWWSRFLGQPG